MIDAKTSGLERLRSEAERCTNCDLYKNATQTVFGEGAATARVLLVGEQPGDREDIEGHPFVGPAGGVLERALSKAGFAREEIYLTNAVKHFKWRPKGKRRIHETPRASEIRACKPWLEGEISALRPRLIVLLGATAVTSVFGSKYRVMANRGRVVESAYGPCLITVHPSSVLRAPDDDERAAAMRLFVEDLIAARTCLEASA